MQIQTNIFTVYLNFAPETALDLLSYTLVQLVKQKTKQPFYFKQ